MLVDSNLEEDNARDRDDESLLTPEDVARKFQVPITWVYGCIRGRSKNVIPHLKIGRYVRFEEDAVRQYLESNRRAYGRSKVA
jgi:excisionase family DNA binding protein